MFDGKYFLIWLSSIHNGMIAFRSDVQAVYCGSPSFLLQVLRKFDSSRPVATAFLLAPRANCWEGHCTLLNSKAGYIHNCEMKAATTPLPSVTWRRSPANYVNYPSVCNTRSQSSGKLRQIILSYKNSFGSIMIYRRRTNHETGNEITRLLT